MRMAKTFNVEIIGYDHRMFILDVNQFEKYSASAEAFVANLMMNPKVWKIEIKRPKK
jgi:hypothetical protein